MKALNYNRKLKQHSIQYVIGKKQLPGGGADLYTSIVGTKETSIVHSARISVRVNNIIKEAGLRATGYQNDEDDVCISLIFFCNFGARV